MTNLDELLDGLNADYQIQGMRCTFGTLLKELPETTREKLQSKIDDPKIPAARLSKVLLEAGHRITADTVQRHRRRSNPSGCRCPR